VATVSAFDVNGPHVLLSFGVVDLSHACVLPGVLTGCQEEDVLAFDLQTSKVCVSLVDSRKYDVFGENSLAIVNPKIMLEKL